MITIPLLRAWNACHDDAKLAALMPGVTEATPRQIAADTRISLDDRLWVLCRCIAHLDESAARLFAIECAATVTHLAGDEDDQAQHAGLLAWLIEIEDLPISQRASARTAAGTAAWTAAWTVAWTVAGTAAGTAAWVAARTAARTAAFGDAISRALEWLGAYADGWEE